MELQPEGDFSPVSAEIDAVLVKEIEAHFPTDLAEQFDMLLAECWEQHDPVAVARAWTTPAVTVHLAALIRIFESAGGDSPRARPRQWILAALYHQRGDVGSELIAMEQAVTDAPHDVVAICALARCAAANGYKELAGTTLDRGIAGNPEAGTVLWDVRAQLHRRFQQYNSEVEVLERLVAMTTETEDPQRHAVFQLRLGVALTHLGLRERAIRSFSKTIELDPTGSKAYIHLAQILEQTNQLRKAERTLEQGAEVSTVPVPILQSLAAMQQRHHNYRKAEQTYQRLRRIAPDELGPCLQLGWLLARRKQVTKAIECFEDALNISPGHPTASNWLRRLRRDPHSYSGAQLQWRNIELREDADVVPLLGQMPAGIAEYLDLARSAGDPPAEWESARRFDAVEYKEAYNQAIIAQQPQARLAKFARAAYLGVAGGSPEPALAALINVAIAIPWGGTRCATKPATLHNYALAAISLCVNFSSGLADHCRRHLLHPLLTGISRFSGDRHHLLYALLLLGGAKEREEMRIVLESRKPGDPWFAAAADLLCGADEQGASRLRQWVKETWNETQRHALARAVVLDLVGASAACREEALETLLDLKADGENKGSLLLPRLASLGENLQTLCHAAPPPELAGALRSKVLGELVELPDRVRHELTAGPTRKTILSILRQIRQIARADFGSGSLDPKLEVGVVTRRLPLRETVELIVAVRNQGNGHAHDVQLSLGKSPGFDLMIGSAAIGILGPGAAAEAALRIRPLQEGDMPVELQVSCNNLDGELIGQSVADVISFYSAREFTRIETPYITGSPIRSPEMFYGRTESIEQIMGRLAGVYQDNPLVIYGQRRTGKTSLLLQLERRLKRRPYIPVYVDLQEHRGARTSRLVKVLMSMLHAHVAAAGVQLAHSVESWRAKAENAPVEAMSDYLRMIGELDGDFRLLLMLDEFESLIIGVQEERISAHLFDLLRHTLQHNRRFSFIFTGADKLKELVSDYASVLFNTAEFIDIGYLTREETINLVRQPVAGRLEYRREAVESVVRATAGHPYYVQLVCAAIVDRMNQEMRTLATEMDVDAATRAIAETETYFTYLWVLCSEEERPLVALISTVTDASTPWVPRREIWQLLRAGNHTELDDADLTRALASLVSKGILSEEQLNREQAFAVRIDLFRMYCARFHPSHIVALKSEEVVANEQSVQ